MRSYAGIDLHSSNNYIGIMDQNFKRLHGRRLPNKLNSILMMLEPFKADLKGIVVESTYNLYWLVDGLQQHGYKVHLPSTSVTLAVNPHCLLVSFKRSSGPKVVALNPSIHMIAPLPVASSSISPSSP